MIKTAIIGCGNIGSKRAYAINNHPESQIKIIIGPKKHGSSCNCNGLEISNELNCKYDVEWRKVLTMDIDAVVLSTPTAYFEEIGTAVLNSGKHLLVEKPLGENLQQAKSITDAAIKNDRILKTGFNLRFDDGIQKARELVDGGRIGKTYFIKVNYVNGAVLTNSNSVGSLLDIGTHSINLAQWFLPDYDIDRIQTETQSLESKNDDNGFVILRNKGVLANIHFSFVRWKNQFTLEISGSEGYVLVESLPKWGGKQLVTYGERIFPSGVPKLSTWEFDTENSWTNEWGYFLKCLKGLDPSYDVKEGLQTMKLADEIRLLGNTTQ
jgi:UDP-N-acetylglucosamine 3-dehydrogenase